MAKKTTKPEVIKTSRKIEKIIKSRFKAPAGGRLSAKKTATILNQVFKVDSPRVPGLSPLKRGAFSIGEGGIYKEQAKKTLSKMKGIVKGNVLLDNKKIAELIKEIGLNKKESYFNVIALENAILLYLTENINKKDIFADSLFVSMLRLYFAHTTADLGVLEEDLASLEARGAMVGRHITLIQKEYEDMVEYGRWMKVMKEMDKKVLKRKETGKLRKLFEKAYKGGERFVVGPAESSSSLLSNLARQAAALWTKVVEEPAAEKISIKETKLWLNEGKETISYIKKFLSKRGNPKLLTDKDIVILSKAIGNELSLLGIQSALVQEVADAVSSDKNVDDLIIDSPVFITLIRLYFAAMIMKMAALEMFMVTLGETKIMTRLRGGFLSDDFNDLVKKDIYEDALNEVSKERGIEISDWTKEGTAGKGLATA